MAMATLPWPPPPEFPSMHWGSDAPPPPPPLPPQVLTRMSSPSLVISLDQPVLGPSPLSSRCSHTILFLFSLSHLAKLCRRGDKGDLWGGRGHGTPREAPTQPLPGRTIHQPKDG